VRGAFGNLLNAIKSNGAPLAHLSKSGVASVRALAQRIYLTIDLWPARELVAVACVVQRKTGQIRLAGRDRSNTLCAATTITAQ